MSARIKRLTWTRKERGWYEATAVDGRVWRIVQAATRRWSVHAYGDTVAGWPTSLAEAQAAAEDEYAWDRELRGGYRRPARRRRPR